MLDNARMPSLHDKLAAQAKTEETEENMTADEEVEEETVEEKPKRHRKPKVEVKLGRRKK